jgi:hypothetical protein
MTEQLAFKQIVREAEEYERRRRDDLRAKVQAWFDDLTPGQKDRLAEWMQLSEFDRCVALSAAAVIGTKEQGIAGEHRGGRDELRARAALYEGRFSFLP